MGWFDFGPPPPSHASHPIRELLLKKKKKNHGINRPWLLIERLLLLRDLIYPGAYEKHDELLFILNLNACGAYMLLLYNGLYLYACNFGMEILIKNKGLVVRGGFDLIKRDYVNINILFKYSKLWTQVDFCWEPISKLYVYYNEFFKP